MLIISLVDALRHILSLSDFMSRWGKASRRLSILPLLLSCLPGTIHKNFFFPGNLHISISYIKNINLFLRLRIKLSIHFYYVFEVIKKTWIFYFYVFNVKFAALKIEYWNTLLLCKRRTTISGSIFRICDNLSEGHWQTSEVDTHKRSKYLLFP